MTDAVPKSHVTSSSTKRYKRPVTNVAPAWHVRLLTKTTDFSGAVQTDNNHMYAHLNLFRVQFLSWFNPERRASWLPPAESAFIGRVLLGRHDNVWKTQQYSSEGEYYLVSKHNQSSLIFSSTRPDDNDVRRISTTHPPLVCVRWLQSLIVRVTVEIIFFVSRLRPNNANAPRVLKQEHPRATIDLPIEKNFYIF